MLKLVLRGFLQRKLRVLLTGIAIALGVALMAGTYVLTDTINQSFAGIFQVANKGNDVVISPTQALGSQTRSQTSPITAWRCVPLSWTRSKKSPPSSARLRPGRLQETDQIDLSSISCRGARAQHLTPNTCSPL